MPSLSLQALNEALIPFFPYRTAKYILIEVPIVGIVHRLCQCAALSYVVINMYYGNGWAMSTVPMGSVNAWAEAGGYTQAAQSTDPFSSVAYCSNPEYAYDYGGEWQYGTIGANPTNLISVYGGSWTPVAKHPSVYSAEDPALIFGRLLGLSFSGSENYWAENFPFR